MKEFDLDEHTLELALNTEELFSRHYGERDIGLRNTFMSQAKDNLIQLEHLMRLREALKIKPKKAAVKAQAALSEEVLKDG